LTRQPLLLTAYTGLHFEARRRYGLSEETKERLGFEVKGREVIGGDGSYELRESPAPYEGIFWYENGVLRLQHGYFWNGNV